MCRVRMYIPWDVCRGMHNIMDATKDKVESRGLDNSCKKGSFHDYDEGFGHDRLRKVVLDELDQALYSPHLGYKKIVIVACKLYL